MPSRRRQPKPCTSNQDRNHDPELGHFALILALCLALAQGILPLIGAHRGNLAWMALARPAATGQFVFLAIAFLSLTYCFVVNDFSVLYVASNSNSALPVQYVLPPCGARTRVRCCSGPASSVSGRWLSLSIAAACHRPWSRASSP